MDDTTDTLVVPGTGITLARHVHPFFHANAWLIMNDSHGILVDTASNGNDDAERLADWIVASGRALQAVVISHGHPDVFLGLRVLASRFPQAAFVVADPVIVDDIVEMGRTLQRYHMLSSEDLAPDRYDYRAVLRPMPPGGLTLAGSNPVTLRPTVTEVPSEFTRLTTLWLPEIDTLFASDLAYNHVHVWAGLGVDRPALRAWQGLLDRLIAAHPGPHTRVLTGHGPATDANVLLAQRAYLTDLLRALDDGLRGDALEAAMRARYPGHAGVEFQLHSTATNPAFG